MTESTAHPVEQWYIVKTDDGSCQVVAALDDPALAHDGSTHNRIWGPYGSQGEAIARRVGLIRSGQCQPQ